MHPAAIIGTMVLVLAAATMLGWVAEIRGLVQIFAGPAMVFNTALCFALVAVAVMLGDPDSRQKARMQQALSGIVIIVAGAALGQHLFGIHTGLDWPALHQWFADDNPHPGRMSRPTAWSFLCCAMALLMMHRVRSLQQGLLVQILTILPALTAVAALAGLMLELRLVYANYLLGQMAAQTAIGFIAISIALWLRWRGMPWYRSRAVLKNEGQRIGLLGALILAVTTFCAMLAGGVATQREIESAISSGLLQAHRNYVNLVTLNIDLQLGRAVTISSRPQAGEHLHALKARGNDADALRHLSDMAGSFLPLGFSGIAFLDHSGREVLRAGRLTEHPEWSVQLKLSHAPRLHWWNDGLVLSARLPILSNDEVVGTVIAEQPLSALAKALKDIEALGQTSEIGICHLQHDKFHCIPQRFMPRVFSVPYSHSLPMSRAVAGETGIVLTRDYRRQYVIATHGPVGALGLGMVVKVDTLELYEPIREYLSIALLLSLLTSAGGGLILYLRVKPLVSEIERSRETIREQGERALRFSENRFAGIIASAMDAIISIDEQQRILLFNHAAERMFRCSAARVTGRRLDMLIPARFRAAHERHIRDFARSSVTTRSMGRLGTLFGLRADGEEFPVEASISQLGESPGKILTVILRDISERVRIEAQARQAEAGLRESQEKLRLFVEHAPAAIAMFDRDMRYLACSRRWLADYGIAESNIVGRSHYEIFPDLPERWKTIHRSCLAGAVEKCDEDPFPRADGSLDWVRWEARPWRDGTGRIGGILIFSEVITARKRAEDSLRQSLARQRKLLHKLAEVEESERRSINRELHDRIGQDLAAAKLNVELARAALPDNAGATRARLNDTLNLMQAMLIHTRNIMAELRPPGLDDYGLPAALSSLAKTVAGRLGIPVRVHADAAAPRLDSALETALYRIVQEALNNVAKHARAGHVDITLTHDGAGILLVIADDGVGFDATAAAGGYGLRGMRERAEAVGAHFDIASRPGAGTRITITVKAAAS